ncbi:hypothetical protein [Caldithrix abyssi]
MEIKDFSLRSKGQIALFRINSKNEKWRFQGSQAATKINRNARKVIFAQIAQIIAEKE